MGKTMSFKQKEEEVEDMNPSCIRVLISAIDYHHRFQKILPHKRHHGTRAKGHGNSNISSQSHEEKNVLSSKSKSKKKEATSKRRSMRACIKKLISHPITKNVNEKVLGSRLLSRSRIKRNFSMNHHCRDVSPNWGHPIIFIPGKKDVQSNKLHDPKQNDKFEEYRNVFKVEKKHSPLHSSRATSRLLKSGSFPAANLLQITSKLNHKRTEIWCHRKREKFVDATLLMKNTLNNCYKDLKLDVCAENVTKSGHRRSYSLNELLDKCTLFLESNLGKERRLHTSTSFKLEIEAFKRNPSFSNFDKTSPLQFGVNKEAISADWSVISSKQTDDLAESVEFSAGISDAAFSDNAEEHDEQTNNNTAIRFSEFPSGVASFSSHDKASTFQEFQSAEGLEKDSDLLDKSLTSCVGNLPDSINNEDLECSGIFKNTFSSTWHSSDKPLINSLFEEIKVFLQQELKCHKEDSCSSWHYQLLLDLVNEELVRLHDRDYPKALSRSCHILRFPVGNKILEEVCSSISALMNLVPEEKEWIDCVVDLDLKRDDSWMNLQWESECVLLDVENIIFHELLEEFKC